MKKAKIIFIIVSGLLCLTNSACTQEDNKANENNTKTKKLELEINEKVIFEPTNNEKNHFDCDYLGQDTPEDEPIMFAPGIVSTNEDLYGFEISPSGKEIIYTRKNGINWLHQTNGKWSNPEVISFSKAGNNGEACFSRDGKKIFFNSRRACSGSSSASNIWISEKKDGVWTKPYYSGLSKSGKTVHAVSLAANDNLYCDGISRFKYLNGKYSEVENIKPKISGAHVFVASDESYLMFDKRVSGKSSDIFIIFSKPDGTWTKPVSMDKINTKSKENQPFVTGDGKYLFFTRNNKVHWVKADFIYNYRKEG